MLVRLSELPRHLAQLPRHTQRQLLAAVIWLALASFCAAALGHHYSQLKQQTIARDKATATAAADWLARQSLEKIVAGDRISLQLLAQQALALPGIAGVTVQDVESNPLAQAGDWELGQTVTAPVVLHDSLAGSVTVNLQAAGNLGFPWASLLLSLVFALPFSAAAALAAGPLLARRPVPVLAGKPKAPVPEIRVGLYLRPLNWAQLGNQLSRAALDKLQSDVAERLQLLRRIYDARPLAQSGPLIGLGFCGEDAAFRAVCCGLLLRELQQPSRAAGLQLAVAVAPAQMQEFSFAGEQLLSQPRGLALHPQLLEDPSLNGRIEYHSTSWGAEVASLSGQYQKLLDSQLDQLLDA
jgi:hypothetical protein